MKTRKMVELAFLMASGIVLQIVEGFLPVTWIVPGFKIGFANIMGLVALSIYDIPSMWIVNGGRIFFASLLQGTLFSVSFWISLSGGILSMLAMTIAKKCGKFSIFGISVMGACFHSIGQVVMVTWLYQQYFMQLFLPVLLALSIVSGLSIALLTRLALKRWKGREV